MKYLEPKKERTHDIELCGKWIKGNLTIQDIKNEINSIDGLIITKLPKIEEWYISSELSLYINEILEDDTITKEQQNQEIAELITNENKKEIKELAKRVIEQIILDGEEFIKYAKEHDYCPNMIRDIEEDQKELKLIAEKVLNDEMQGTGKILDISEVLGKK